MSRARALARDVNLWLADEPIPGAPDPRAERLRRWSRKNPEAYRNVILLTSLIGLLLVVLVGLLGIQNQIVKRERKEARLQSLAAKEQKTEAEKQKGKAVAQTAEAEKQKTKAETQTAEAEKQKGKAVAQTAEAVKQRQPCTGKPLHSQNMIAPKHCARRGRRREGSSKWLERSAPGW